MLSEYILPRVYDLSFDVDMKNFRFKCVEKIRISLLRSSNNIVLNSKKLSINKVKLEKNGETIFPRFSSNDKDETLSIDLDKKIKGNWNLFIEFKGNLSEDLKGFYLSKYNHKGKDKYLATTQFEAPYARKTFPCFDEPGKKAEFLVSISTDKNLETISNMPIISEEIKGNKKLVKFERTPLMSTYLLYMGVGEFEYFESDYENRIKIRIVTTSGKKSQGKFALDITKKVLKYFEDYTGIDYPLPKLDMIAIPDFAATAMENWGAIIFREIALLTSKNSSFRVKRRIAMVIAHELWHMWSGNLVTMKWWNDLWLNESFANYMAFKALDYYFPEWNIWEYYLEEETLGALDADSLKTTHPISVDVKSPNEIEELFDEISYGKGGSVLRMIDSFLGEETFRKGVSFYLDKFKYSNAEADDFWICLSKFSKENIREIARSWINQPGYPLLKVESRGNNLVIEQEAFQDSFRGQKWLIPLTIRSGGKVKTVLITKRRQKIKINSKNFKLNYNQTGFFRVEYSRRDLRNIKKLVGDRKISSIDLFGICNDLFYLALYGRISIDHYIEFIKICNDEKDYLVLAEIHRSLHKIDRIFSNLNNWNVISGRLNKQFEGVFLRSFSNLGWVPKKQETINETLLRPITISNLSLLKNEKIIKEGEKKFNSFHKDIRSAGYGLIASNGGESEYEKMLEKYRKEKDVEKKRDLLISLYRFEDLGLLKKSLDFIFSGEVRLQDYRYVFLYIGHNKKFGELFFNFVKKNWNKFNKHKDSFFIFSRFLEALIITNLKKLGEVHNFLEDKEIVYKKTKEEAFENARVQKTFLDKNSVIIREYLYNLN